MSERPVLPATFARLYIGMTGHRGFRALAAMTRGLLSASFLDAGWVKIAGHRFTSLPPETPIGGFFEALYQAGSYYRFLGAAQVGAAALLPFARTSALGALIFLPILLNIFAITLSLGFQGTPVVVAAMLVGNLFLLGWDLPRLLPIVADPSLPGAPCALRADPVPWQPALALALGIPGAMGMMSGVRSGEIVAGRAVLLAAAVFVGLHGVAEWRRTAPCR